MVRRSLPTFASVLVLAALCTGGDSAFAGGFALRQQSTSAVGNAYAGATAGADDASYMFFNPAAISLQDGSTAIASGWMIYADVELDANASNVTGAQVSGEDGHSRELFFLPNLAMTTEATDDVTLGFNLTSPFGLGTFYGDSWAGRYYATDSKLVSAEVTPTIAYDVTDALSVAAGLRVIYVDASLERAIDFATIGSVLIPAGGGPVIPGGTDGFSKLEANAFGYGFTLGMLWQITPATRIGLSYRSEIDLDLDGNAKVNTAGNPVNDVIAAAAGVSSTPAEADLTLPRSARISIHHDLTTKWSVAADVEWTDWRSLDQLDVRSKTDGTSIEVLELDWDDAFAVSVGATYRKSKEWTFRLGAMYDQSPIPGSTRGPIVPETDRLNLGLGVEYGLSDYFSVLAGYQFAYFLPGDINLSAADDPAAGNLQADIDATAHAISLGVKLTF